MAAPTPGRTRPWLFEAFPALERSIPWLPLITAPTRVERLENISARLGRDVWIKRDDRTSPLYGGNKPRKLEFVLAKALEQEKRILITGGGLGTNHGLATAIFGAKLGFKVRLWLFEQPVSEHVRKNLLLFHSHGAEMVYMTSPAAAVLYHGMIEKGFKRNAYFVAPGGSSLRGTLGYVDAGLELARQIEHKELPLPEMIFVALGSSGTMAGLCLGLRLAGLKIPVTGVRVVPRFLAGKMIVFRLAHKTFKLMRYYDRTIPDPELTFSDLIINHAYYGSGYGHPTDAGREAVELIAGAEGIHLEQTYTGKAFGALLDFVTAGPGTGPVLFWNTFNSVDLSPLVRGKEYLSLPEEFHRFFT